jgi:hypothetical protein
MLAFVLATTGAIALLFASPAQANSSAVFERFWRGDHGRPGSGLGLAIVRATAERHGGTVSVDGSRFTIELPALRDLSELDGTTQEEASEKGTP